MWPGFGGAATSELSAQFPGGDGDGRGWPIAVADDANNWLVAFGTFVAYRLLKLVQLQVAMVTDGDGR